MGDKSAIEWCDATWNPVTGCSHVSPGCEHCYAEALSLRFGWSKHPWGAQWAAENVVFHADRLKQPLSRKRPARIFVNSMSDLFHERVPFAFILRVFIVMSSARRHTYQILTKRPERMLAFFRWWELNQEAISAGTIAPWQIRYGFDERFYQDPWPNVWLGVSVEDQRRADERIPLLLQTPAAVRFLSVEPMLGPVSLYSFGDPDWDASGKCTLTSRISWVICGGESGPHFRPMDPEWARCLRGQCAEMGIPFLFKQWGGRTPKAGGRLLDGREWNEYPDSTPVLQSAVPR